MSPSQSAPKSRGPEGRYRGVRRIHPFKLIAIGGGARQSWFRAYRSKKYPQLEVWIFGKRGDRKFVRQYRIKGYDTVDNPVNNLTEAIRICRSL